MGLLEGGLLVVHLRYESCLGCLQGVPRGVDDLPCDVVGRGASLGGEVADEAVDRAPNNAEVCLPELVGLRVGPGEEEKLARGSALFDFVERDGLTVSVARLVDTEHDPLFEGGGLRADQHVSAELVHGLLDGERPAGKIGAPSSDH
jgi:hypothetical protein